MTTSTPTSELSQGSGVSPTATPLSSRDRMGMMWGKEEVDMALLSDSREEEEELSLVEGLVSKQEVGRCQPSLTHPTFSIVYVLQEGLELLLVQDGALCVSLA